jgi:hypothetical protein
MRTQHTLTIHCRCPLDNARDQYELTVTTHRLIKVEDILAEVRAIAASPMLQEHLTADLAAKLDAHITTVGYHSGVRTTCTTD